MSNLIRNSVICDDGTVLESKTRHDCRAYKSPSGTVYMVDGGLDYTRGYLTGTPNHLTLDDPHEMGREAAPWGSYGKDGKQDLMYIPVKDMEDGHIEAILRDCMNIRPSIETLLKREVLYRNGVKEPEKVLDILEGNTCE